MIADYVRMKKSIVAQGKRRALRIGEEFRVVEDRLAYVWADDSGKLVQLWGWEFEWIMGKGKAVRG